MRRSPLFYVLGLVLAPVGLVLLAVQVVRVVGYDATLGTVGKVVLWGGVGLLALGLLLLTLTAGDDGTIADDDYASTDEAGGEDEPPRKVAAPARPRKRAAKKATPRTRRTDSEDVGESEPARPVKTAGATKTTATGASSVDRLRRRAAEDDDEGE